MITDATAVYHYNISKYKTQSGEGDITFMVKTISLCIIFLIQKVWKYTNSTNIKCSRCIVPHCSLVNFDLMKVPSLLGIPFSPQRAMVGSSVK